MAAKATDALNEQVFAALELPDGDLDTVNRGLRALRVAAGDPDASGRTLVADGPT